MSDNITAPTAEAKLRKKIADTEAALEILREKLEKLLAKPVRKKAEPTGLEEIWKAAPDESRARSSRQQLRSAWNRIPTNARPSIETVIDGIHAWSKSHHWKKEEGRFILGVHRFIQRRKWEELPTATDPLARHTPIPKPALTAPAPEDVVTDKSEIRRLLSLKPQDT